VTVTPEAVLLDDRGRVRYRGRIDDQFAARQRRNAAPRTHELRDAIAAVLAGREVAEPHVEAVGCPLPEVPEEAAVPTFSRDVASILRENCQECHRRGQVGPFPLETFAQARKRADDIAAVVESHAMPPWKPVPGVGPRFKNDRSLAPLEVDTLVAWAQAGAPEEILPTCPTPRVRRPVGPRHPGPRPGAGRGVRHPRRGPRRQRQADRHLPLLRPADGPARRCLHLGHRVPPG
jgi:hypothetical protein